MKKLLMLFIAIVLVAVPLGFRALLQSSDSRICTSYQGFAVDEDRNLYIGMDHAIAVYDSHGKEFREVELPTSRGYKFTISDNNEIIIYTGENFYIADLCGEVRQVLPVTDENRRNAPEMSYRSFTAADGTKYVMKSWLFRPAVYRLDDEQKVMIYEMPDVDYCAKLIDMAVLIGLFAVCITAAFSSFKTKKRCTD